MEEKLELLNERLSLQLVIFHSITQSRVISDIISKIYPYHEKALGQGVKNPLPTTTEQSHTT